MKNFIFLLTFLMLFTASSCRKDEPVAGMKEKKISTQSITTTEVKIDMEKLLDPLKANEKAPESFKVRFKTTKGDILLEIYRNWAPNGVDRFYNLVKAGFFTDTAFFRVLKGFVAQFGINGDPKINAVWRAAKIPDDPVKQSNIKGTLTFATAGPNTRTTQLFINYANNSRLDTMGFSPIGKVIEGMDVVENLYSDYGEGYPQGSGPEQGKIQTQGNEYLKFNFPNLDYILSATLE